MIIALSCGHITVVNGWPDMGVICRKHTKTMMTGLMAIECREWKTTCRSCRFARWFGQDKTSANLAAVKHRHECNVDFLARDEMKAKVRELYPRTVKHFIANWEANRKPGGRHMPQPTMFPVKEEPDDDEPPF